MSNLPVNLSWDGAALAAFGVCAVLIAYNLVGYPLFLRLLGRRRLAAAAAHSGGGSRPTVTIIIPAFNEARHIARKVENTLSLRHDGQLPRIVIAFDGCTDRSEEIARAAAARLGGGIEFRVYAANRGKVAVLNEEVARADTEVVLLTDVSAMLPAHALESLTRHFADPAVGVVCPAYAASEAGSAESAYWNVQTRLKRIEAAIAAPIGPHGACYLFRRNLWEPLPPDTINDDFMLPMRIVSQGHAAIYDDAVVVQETEPTSSKIEFRRRLRIGAGNLQQVIRLARLAHPARPKLAFLFLSGKGLRAFVPLLALVAGICAVFLAARAVAPFGAVIAAACIGLALSLPAYLGGERFLPRPLRVLSYVVTWLVASALGSLMLLLGAGQGLWSASNLNKKAA